MSFGCEHSCSSHRRVSNFNSKVPQRGIYPHNIKFERDRLNIFLVVVFLSSGSTGGGRGGNGDAETIISSNTLFGDIINVTYFLDISVFSWWWCLYNHNISFFCFVLL